MAKEGGGERGLRWEERFRIEAKKAHCRTKDYHNWGTSIIYFWSNMNLNFRHTLWSNFFFFFFKKKEHTQCNSCKQKLWLISGGWKEYFIPAFAGLHHFTEGTLRARFVVYRSTPPISGAFQASIASLSVLYKWPKMVKLGSEFPWKQKDFF